MIYADLESLIEVVMDVKLIRKTHLQQKEVNVFLANIPRLR